MRREIALACLIASAAPALAQTVPAEMGITPSTTPEVLQTLDNTKTWVPLGTVNSTTHKFNAIGGAAEADILVTDPSVGMAAGGTDNSPFVAALMTKQMPAAWGGYDVLFPGIPGQTQTVYYFSKTFMNQRTGSYHCSGGSTGGYLSTYLVFAAGVDGVLEESNALTPDGTIGGGDLSSCYIVSMGYGSATANTATPTVLTAVNFYYHFAGVPSSAWHVGDGIVLTTTGNAFFALGSEFPVPIGATITAVNPTTGDLTLSNPVPQSLGHVFLPKATATFTQTGTHNFVAGDTIKIGPTTYTFTTSVPYGTAPTAVLIGTDFATSANNLVAAINGGYGRFALYAPPINGPYAFGADPLIRASYASGVITFTSVYGPPDANTYPSVYTAVGAAAGGFGGATFSGANASATASMAFYQLPVEKVFKVRTTVGSSTVTVVSGPQLLKPNDVIWSDAFPFGATVITASGTLGAQTLTITRASNTGEPVNATVAHASGAEGNLWILPAGIKRRAPSKSDGNFLSGWPIGLLMSCSSGGGVNCDLSRDMNNSIRNNFVGRWVGGDNTATATSMNDEYSGNYLMDVWEGAELGEIYYNVDFESPESAASKWGIVQNCANQNYSMIFGGYAPGGLGGCSYDGNMFPPVYGGVAHIGTLAAGTASAGAPAMNRNAFYNGMNFWGGPDGNQCVSISGPASSWWALAFSSNNCVQDNIVALSWFPSAKTWGWFFDFPGNSAVMQFVDKTWGSVGYLGPANAGVFFPFGVLVGDAENGANNARSITAGPNPNVSYTHISGDIQINAAAAKGGNAVWSAVPDFTTTATSTIAAGAGSVSVAACPTLALPAIYTEVVDATPAVPYQLELYGGCTGTTLSFYGGAYRAANSGDTIQLISWYPAAKISNDRFGASYPVGALTDVASLLANDPCTSDAAIGLAVVANGETVAAKGYSTPMAVGGSTRRLVFCDGTSWTYH